MKKEREQRLKFLLMEAALCLYLELSPTKCRAQHVGFGEQCINERGCGTEKGLYGKRLLALPGRPGTGGLLARGIETPLPSPGAVEKNEDDRRGHSLTPYN